MNPWVIGVPLMALAMALVTHIFIMARWSGKVDANLTQIMAQPGQWKTEVDDVARSLRNEINGCRTEVLALLAVVQEEVKALRLSRHEVDGKVAQHEGALREIGRRLDIHGERQ